MVTNRWLDDGLSGAAISPLTFLALLSQKSELEENFQVFCSSSGQCWLQPSTTSWPEDSSLCLYSLRLWRHLQIGGSFPLPLPCPSQDKDAE